MFVIVEAGGMQTAYVPGQFRQRKVDPIQKVLPLDHVDRRSQQSPNRQSPQRLPVELQAYEAVETMMKAGRSTILAKDVMSSPVVSLPSEAKLLEAQDLIQHRRFRHIPITNGNGNVVGILSDRDVLRGTADPTVYKISTFMNPAQTSIDYFMSQPVLVAKPETEIRAIARVMFEEHIGAMPIVSETGQLVGIITRSDILRLLISHPDFDRWV